MVRGKSFKLAYGLYGMLGIMAAIVLGGLLFAGNAAQRTVLQGATADNAYQVSTTIFIAILLLLGLMGGLIATLLASLKDKEHQITAYLNTSVVGIVVINAKGVVIEFNAMSEHIFGYSKTEVVGKNISMLMPEPDRSAHDGYLQHYLSTGQQKIIGAGREVMAQRKDESIFSMELCIGEALQGKQRTFIGVVRDISKRKQNEADLKLAAAAFDSQEAIFIATVDEKIERVNSAFTKITGYESSEAVGQSAFFCSTTRDGGAFNHDILQSLRFSDFWQGEVWNRHKDGHSFPAWLTVTVVRDHEGKTTHLIGNFLDISWKITADETIHDLAFYDVLTKLPNRQLLLNRLAQASLTSERTRRHWAILSLDLDNFKNINDTMGHKIGDMLLIETARRIKRCVRGEDTVARLGGDEFVILLENLSPDVERSILRVKHIAEKIVTQLSVPYLLNHHTHHSSTSVGIALSVGDEVVVDVLLSHADTAMHAAKKAGRNTLCFFDSSMQIALEKRVLIEEALREAITEQQFELHYQIQVDDQQSAIGAEALIRWMHPAQGMISPLDFIPLAEDMNQMPVLGKWVLETACQQLKTWETLPHAKNLTMAVNVSAQQFKAVNFVAEVLAIADQYQIDKSKLKLELTESMVLDNVSEAVAKMQELRDTGIKLSMDDFGTGYSSLSYIKRLPFDQLKIDRSFTSQVGTDKNDAFIVQMVSTMGKMLNMEVVAEGVETIAQFEHLRDLGCAKFQGYFFGKPMTSAALHELLITLHTQNPSQVV